MAKPIKYKAPKTDVANFVQEPMASYQAFAPMPFMAQSTAFTYNKFATIAATVPFTQKEWAGILHLSDRTLQRYALSNTAFEGIYVDRILHIQQLLQLGLQTFTTSDAFYLWLKKDKNVMGQLINFQSLLTTQGIQATINQVGRILHNVYS
jgi:hypothetical protein